MCPILMNYWNFKLLFFLAYGGFLTVLFCQPHYNFWQLQFLYDYEMGYLFDYLSDLQVAHKQLVQQIPTELSKN